MKEFYRKGVANHLALCPAASVVRLLPKRGREVSVGWVLSFEKTSSGRRPCGQKGKAILWRAQSRESAAGSA